MESEYLSLNQFFEEMFKDIDCQPYTRAYITSIFTKYKIAESDLSKDSITLLFAQARGNHDFYLHQTLGDWIFFINTLAPNHLQFASKDYYDTIAQLSYYYCFKITHKKLKFYEELSDNFKPLCNIVKRVFTKNTLIM